MSEHRYILEPYKGMRTRYRCPECNNRDKTFVRYIDTQTGEHLADYVGRCNRESNCGYHYTPKQYFQDNRHLAGSPIPKQYTKPQATVKPLQKPVSFIPVEVFKQSLHGYESNHFLKFLCGLFGAEITSRLIEKYFIGSSKHWPGASVFWQIDRTGRIRTGKIMLYNPITGKRVKKPYNHITWAHSVLKPHEFELGQCLFGEHLLRDKTKPVAIVESEKTAIIASVYLPQFIWLAVGSLTNLNAEKCTILKGRTVTLFPDLNGFNKWSAKAKELSHLTSFNISDLLERKASETERQQGLDLADYLVRFDYREFQQAEQPKPQQVEFQQPRSVLESIVKAKVVSEPPPYFPKHENSKAETWEPEITELEKFFETATLPTQPVKLNAYTTITDVSLFIHSHLETVKARNGNPIFLPYLHRLQELRQLLGN